MKSSLLIKPRKKLGDFEVFAFLPGSTPVEARFFSVQYDLASFAFLIGIIKSTLTDRMSLARSIRCQLRLRHINSQCFYILTIFDMPLQTEFASYYTVFASRAIYAYIVPHFGGIKASRKRIA
jgi:hypothetical protein